MKKLLFLSLLAIITTGVFSQNAYYDAIYLNTISKKALDQIITANNSRYILLSEDESEQIGNAQKFIANPFDKTISEFSLDPVRSAINKYNTLLKSEYSTGGYSAFSGAASLMGLIPSALSGDFSLSAEEQTKILDGLTKYYSEEFKKAQLLSYMNTFESTIGEVGELQVLFPSTYNKLKNTNPSKFPELGDEYKDIFNQDLKSLLDNLISHIDTHKVNSPIEDKLKLLNYENIDKIRKSNYYGGLRISADIGSKLINSYHPVDLFNYLDSKYYSDSILLDKKKSRSFDQKLALILHGVNLMQSNLLDTTKSPNTQFSNIWLGTEEFKKLNTNREWTYFAGLLYQQDKDFFSEYFFAPPVSITNENIEKVKQTFTSMLTGLIEIQNFRSELDDSNLSDNYLKYMTFISEVLEEANNTNEDLSTFFKLSNYTLNVYDNARSKDYNNSIHYTILILNEFLGEQENYLEVMYTLDQYGTFMTDVINSENSDEVKDVIKKHAAPPASFNLKREYLNTFSITGQPGYFASYEKLSGEWSFVSGITLPMGFEYTRKLKSGQSNSGSLGLFLQVIDLGAMLNFRVDNSTSTLPDKVEFSQMFSPGGSLNYGFKNSPLNIGIGYQYTPELRKVTLADGNEFYPNGHRWFVRLAWDIPLINIGKSKSR